MRALSSADSTQELIKYKEEIMESVLSLVKKYLEEQALKNKPVATHLDQPTPPGIIQRPIFPEHPSGQVAVMAEDGHNPFRDLPDLSQR